MGLLWVDAGVLMSDVTAVQLSEASVLELEPSAAARHFFVLQRHQAHQQIMTDGRQHQHERRGGITCREMTSTHLTLVFILNLHKGNRRQKSTKMIRSIYL